MITKPTLDAKDTAGVVGKPEYAPEVTNIIATKSADMKNTATDLNQTASTENLSAKWKNPQVKQEVKPVQVQYEDHS
jgi:hypothetical protein